MLTCKGYTGRMELGAESGILHGEVLDLKEVITFQGTSAREVERALRDSSDDCLVFCEERGEVPDKPFSGRLMPRLSPDLHRKVSVRAQHAGKSLNQWIAERLENDS